MTKTVSARLPEETHSKLVNKCNELGCTVNYFLSESVRAVLDDLEDFTDKPKESEIKPVTVTLLPDSHVPNTTKEITKARITRISYDDGKTWLECGNQK